MAVENRPLNARLQIRFITGKNEKGEDIIRTKTLSNVKVDALDQDIYDVASALQGLTSNGVASIRKVEESDLVSA